MLPSIDETTSIHQSEQDINDSTSNYTNINTTATQKTYNTITNNTNNLNGDQRIVVISESQPLARYSVLYLGTAIPSDDERGLDSIQNPLSKRYPVDGKEVVQGIEAWLSIDENSLEIQFARDPSVILYYPIRSLVYCATIRFAIRTETGEQFPNGWRFVPLDYPETNFIENLPTPPIFAITFHRTRNSPMDECHCFVTKTKQAALALVKACHSSYQTTDPGQDCSKVPLYFKINNDGSQIEEIDNEIYTVSALEKEQSLNYLTNRDTSGFFYTTDKISIDSWKLWEPNRSELRRSPSVTSSSYRQNRQHRLSSIISIPDSQKLRKSPSIQTLNEQPKTTSAPLPPVAAAAPSPPPLPAVPPAPPLLLTIDPYAPDPNVIHVERIKDSKTGREIFIRFLRNPPNELPPPPVSNPPINNNVNDQDEPEKNLPNEMQRLVLNDEITKKSVTLNDQPQAIPIYHKRKKSKRRHKHRHHYEQNQPIPTYPNYQQSYSQLFDRYTPSNLQRSFTFTPIATPQLYTFPIAQQAYTSPVPQRTYASPIPQQTYTSPTPQPTYASPIPQRTYASPIPQQTYTSPIPQQPYNPPSYGMTYHTMELSSPSNNNAPFWFYTA